VGGSRLLAVAVVGLLAMGCSSTAGHGSLDPISAYFGPGGSPIPALDQPAGKAATSSAQAAKILQTDFPATAPGVPGASLTGARDVVIRILSALHADPRWLCGSWTGKDPVEAQFPPGGRWIRDPKTDPYRKHHVMYQLPGCDQVRLSATYLGDQQFQVRADPDNKANVRVDHTGEFTYDTRSLGNGVRLPVHALVHRTFVLSRIGGTWRLTKLINSSAQVAPGYGKALPRYTGVVPGLQQGNQVGTADPAAMRSVLDALGGTIGAGTAKVTFDDRSTAPWRQGAPDPRAGDMWPTRGLALYTYAVPKKPAADARYAVREFVIGKAGDYNQFNKPDADGRKYTQFDPRQPPDVASIPADSNPYVVLATLAQLDAASPTACQSADKSQSCFIAHIPVNRLAVAGILTTRAGFAYASYGCTDLNLRVGVTGGKISMISQDAILPVVGHGVLSLHWRFGFESYAAAGAPPALTPPPTAEVTKLD
jgi:hypothetical protein